MPPHIDAHHHLWTYKAEEFPWISEEMPALRRDFLPADLTTAAGSSGIEGTVVVQARQTLAETGWLLQLAEQEAMIRGVVGWVPLADARVEAKLEQLAQNRWLKGVRHILHDEPDDNYVLRADFNDGVSLLERWNLRYDILILERHLPQAIAFIDLHPRQRFILDHIAKPRIREKVMEPWKQNILELAHRENVYCKLSGMVTEADWTAWTPSDLAPYFDVVLEAFGPHRLMFGSDWPVLNLASSYERWHKTVAQWLGGLTVDEQARILGATAVEAYCL